jgi:hypothetical protein
MESDVEGLKPLLVDEHLDSRHPQPVPPRLAERRLSEDCPQRVAGSNVSGQDLLVRNYFLNCIWRTVTT